MGVHKDRKPLAPGNLNEERPIKRLSIDCKARWQMGAYGYGGKTCGDRRAADHDRAKDKRRCCPKLLETSSVPQRMQQRSYRREATHHYVEFPCRIRALLLLLCGVSLNATTSSDEPARKISAGTFSPLSIPSGSPSSGCRTRLIRGQGRLVDWLTSIVRTKHDTCLF